MTENATNTTIPDQSMVKSNRYIEVTAGFILLAGIIWILSLLFNFGRYVKTNNAQVETNMATVNSRVAGYIHEIRFESYTTVRAGDTLVLIDDSEFRIMLAQANADLAIAKANLNTVRQSVVTSISSQEATEANLRGNKATLERAQKNFERFENMYTDSAVTRNQFDQVIAQLKTEQAYVEASEKETMASKSMTEQYRHNYESALATVQRKEADLAEAKLQMSYTIITAPVNGVLGERTIQTGELVNNNQALVYVVEGNEKWIIANFKETQLNRIRTGSKVIIRIDALGGKQFLGTVRDLSPATGAKFSMIEPDNSTGNFVKITQRIPVLIVFEASEQELATIKSGMNATVKVKR
jgi:membrane fusion protein (multidrug efflux system)